MYCHVTCNCNGAVQVAVTSHREILHGQARHYDPAYVCLVVNTTLFGLPAVFHANSMTTYDTLQHCLQQQHMDSRHMRVGLPV
jgi:hypothetical protein